MHCTSGSAVKNLPAVQETQETWVRSLGWEDPLEEEMATHSGILAGKSPWIIARWATVHGVAKRGTEHAHIHPEKIHDCPMYADAGLTEGGGRNE